MRDDAVVGLEHVAGAGQHQRVRLVGDDHHRLEPAQIAVGAPVLGELDGGAHQLVGILLELGFEPLEQGEGIGGGAGEAGDHLAAGEPADLAWHCASSRSGRRRPGRRRRSRPCRPCGPRRWSCRASREIVRVVDMAPFSSSDESCAAAATGQAERLAAQADVCRMECGHGAPIAAHQPRCIRDPRTGRASTPPDRPNETEITVVSVNLDGTGRADIETGIGFLDHMLDQLGRHSLIDLRCAPRATCTSTSTTPPRMSASCSARRCTQALGDKRGIRRYASARPADGRHADPRGARRLRPAVPGLEGPVRHATRSARWTPSCSTSCSRPSP